MELTPDKRASSMEKKGKRKSKHSPCAGIILMIKFKRLCVFLSKEHSQPPLWFETAKPERNMYGTRDACVHPYP